MESKVPLGVSNPDGLLRMNYLFQAASLVSHIPQLGSNSVILSRVYITTMKSISQKLVLRMY